MYKTKVLKDYEQAFFLQCSLRNKGLERFIANIDVYFSSNRPDLDNSAKVILDCLQECKAIANDRGCVELHMRKFVDKSNPRAEIELLEV